MDDIIKGIHNQINTKREHLSDTLEKGRALPIGTVKKRGPNNMIKTATGWKYHSRANKKSGSAPKEDVKKPKISNNDLQEKFNHLQRSGIEITSNGVVIKDPTKDETGSPIKDISYYTAAINAAHDEYQNRESKSDSTTKPKTKAPKRDSMKVAVGKLEAHFENSRTNTGHHEDRSVHVDSSSDGKKIRLEVMYDGKRGIPSDLEKKAMRYKPQLPAGWEYTTGKPENYDGSAMTHDSIKRADEMYDDRGYQDSEFSGSAHFSVKRSKAVAPKPVEPKVEPKPAAPPKEPTRKRGEFKPKPFKSEKVKVGDRIVHQFSNGKAAVHVTRIEGKEIFFKQESFHDHTQTQGSEMSEYSFTGTLQNEKDESDKVKYWKDRDYQKNAAALEKKLGNIKGGNLNQRKNLSELGDALGKIKEFSKQFDSDKKDMSHTGKAVTINFNTTASGGKYGSPYALAIEVQFGNGLRDPGGSGVKAMKELTKEVLGKFQHTSSLGSSSVSSPEGGWNWSSVVLRSPQGDNKYTPLSEQAVQVMRNKIAEQTK